MVQIGRELWQNCKILVAVFDVFTLQSETAKADERRFKSTSFGIYGDIRRECFSLTAA